MATTFIASQLKYYRNINHYSQQQVADYLGIAASAYNHYESGARTPDAEKLSMLARLYNLEDQILGVHKKDTATDHPLKAYKISDLLDNLQSETASLYSLQSNKTVKKNIHLFEPQFNALIQYFKDYSKEKAKLLSEIASSKNGNEGKLYEALVYAWMSDHNIPYSTQPHIEACDCLKQHDYYADGEIEGCIFDVKTFGITLPNIDRLKAKLNKLCSEKHPDYYITVSGNLDISNDILNTFLSSAPDILSNLFNDSNKAHTDYIYKLQEYDLQFRANSTLKAKTFTTVSEFDPYKWAKENQFYFFHDASQFCVNKPYVIICPYDKKLAKHLAFGNTESLSTSFRSLCRRMFMGMPDDKYISEYDNHSIPMVSLNHASRCISAVIFQDISMYSDNDDTWIYVNPNAMNKFPRCISLHFQSWTFPMYENYMYDCY